MTKNPPATSAIVMRSAKAIIIGTGFGGLAAAIRMKQQHDDDFIVIERSGDVGGVWRDNQYPGCACDVQSHLYSFSFAPNPGWSREYSPQPEIWNYLRDCAKKFGVLPHMHFNTTVERLDWNEKRGEWVVRTTAGEYRGRYVFAGMGSLSEPMIPDIKGLRTFKGLVVHSGAWPHGLDLQGKSVAVIGTGASSIQFVPKIQPQVSALHLFQRTAPWVMERHDFKISERTQRNYARIPGLQRLERMKIYLQRESLALGFRNPGLMRLIQRQAIKHMHKAIKDPALRKKLTPGYTLGCKRILISNDYYPALAQPNVDVVTAGIDRVTELGIRGKDGVERAVDVIILGTGFQVQDLPFSHWIYGHGGQSLSATWNGSPQALAGSTVNGFPNLFLLHGPNTALGHSSVIYMMEAQAEHGLRLMKLAERTGSGYIEARAEAQKRYVQWLDRQMKGTVWTAGGCESWYMDKTGRNSSLWPGYTFAFRSRLMNIRPEEYDLLKSTQPQAA